MMFQFMSTLWVYVAILLSACGYLEKIKPKDNDSESKPTLQEKYNELKNSYTGWPSISDCDGMLWASEAVYGGIKNINLNDARDENGKLFRRPSKDCFNLNDSRSEFSNDMLTGYILSSSVDDTKRYYEYLKRNNFSMGDGDPGATILKPNLLGVMERAISINSSGRLPYLKNDKDYVRHIQTLMIYIDGRSTGFINADELNLLKYYYNDSPDYLIGAVIAKYTGDYDEVNQTLLAGLNPPSYVRGDEPEKFAIAHWLLATKIVLKENK